METKSLYKVARLFNVSGYTIYEWCIDSKLCEHEGNFLMCEPNNFISINSNGTIMFTQLGIDLLEACMIKK